MTEQHLIQIVYISRSTFEPVGKTQGIEPGVARILAKSRINNQRRQFDGVLYFGDGYFLQCLEGEEEAIDALYETLKTDPRHTDLKLLSRNTITQRSFSEWSMKYVPVDLKMKRLLQENGYDSFNPYRFDTPMLGKMMALLRAAADPTALHPTTPEAGSEAASDADTSAMPPAQPPAPTSAKQPRPVDQAASAPATQKSSSIKRIALLTGLLLAAGALMFAYR